MRLRSPSLPLHGYDDLSSPDPLASTFDNGNNDSSIRLSSPVRRAPSPGKYGTVVEDITISTPQKARRRISKLATSPSRTVTEQTLSPWKIRVTVEAEAEDTSGNGRMLTRTIKVPLREASSPLENANLERIGRNSQPGTAKSKRIGMPLRARSNSRSRRQSVTNLDIVVLGDDADSNEWSKQKSPKKRKPRLSKKRNEEAIEDGQGEKVADGHHAPESSNRPMRKKNTDQGSFEIRQDTDEEVESLHEAAKETESPELRTIDLNRVSMRARSASARQKEALPKDDRIEALISEPSVPPTAAGRRQVSHASADSYPTPTPSIESEEDEPKEPLDPAEAQEGFDTVLESEGFTMIDLESLPSAMHPLSNSPTDRLGHGTGTPQPPAEGYTDHGNARILEETPSSKTKPLRRLKTRPTPIPSYLTLPEGDSDISSNVPSSPPVAGENLISIAKHSQDPSRRPITPQTYSSPKLPSPPKPPSPESLQVQKTERKTTPPTLTLVVKAGIALQEGLSPKPTSSKPSLLSPYQQRGTPTERLDNLFDGFDSGTKRELRAGLRLGEELARRLPPSPAVQSRIRSAKSLQPQPQAQLPARSQPRRQVWRGENVVQYTPIASFQQSEPMPGESCTIPAMDVKEQTKKRMSLMGDQDVQKAREHTPVKPIGRLGTPAGLDTMGKREQQWQLERETVSREIENANASQVILLDSDNDEAENVELASGGRSIRYEDCNQTMQPSPQLEAEDVERDDGDVWLEEAEAYNSSSSNIETADRDHFLQNVKSKKRNSDMETHVRPRRSLIPSPWKRGEEVAEASTLLTHGDMTGLFWQQPQDMIKFGAGDIERQKKHMSGSSEAENTAAAQDDMQGTSQLANAEPAEHETDVLDQTEHENAPADQSMLDHRLENDTDSDDDDDELSERQDAEDVAINEANINSYESGSDVGNSSGVSSYDSSPIPPQPVKIPVNFNDSTLSNISGRPPPLTRSSPSQAAESSRPSTPRSAIKGSRRSVGLEKAVSPSVRKVVFSERSLALDIDGFEVSEIVRSSSPMPPLRFEAEKEVVEVQQGRKEQAEEPAKVSEDKGGWFGWLRGKPKNEPAATAVISNTDGAGDERWKGTKVSIPSISTSTSRSSTSPKPPSYLRPPSYPSDPTRDPQIPLATAGDFTNTHFRTLHIIYRKSLRPKFHGPKIQEARPALRQLLGQKFSVDESQAGLGVFEWAVGEREVRVVERFMREVEFGWKGAEVRWSWNEMEIVERLFRVVVGEVVRAEEGRVQVGVKGQVD